MRWALLVLIALAACHRPGAPSAAQIYDEARNLLRREQYAAAWAKAAPGLEQTKPGSYWHWKFRLLKIEILLGQREGVKAQKELESLRLPSGPEWTADRGRYCLYQAHAAFLQNQYAEARARLAEARALAEAAGSAGLAAELVPLRRGHPLVRGDSDPGSQARRRRFRSPRHGQPGIVLPAPGRSGQGRAVFPAGRSPLHRGPKPVRAPDLAGQPGEHRLLPPGACQRRGLLHARSRDRPGSQRPQLDGQLAVQPGQERHWGRRLGRGGTLQQRGVGDLAGPRG